MEILSYTKESVKSIAQSYDYQKALDLLNKNQINNLDYAESDDYNDCLVLEAEVQDRFKKYNVSIDLITPDPDDTPESDFPYWIEENCSCYSYGYCEHVLATLLAFQQIAEQGGGSLEDLALSKWLETLHIPNASEFKKEINSTYGLYFELIFDEEFPLVVPKLYRHLKNGTLGAEKQWYSYDLDNDHFTEEDKECIVALEAINRLNEKYTYLHHRYDHSYILAGIQGDKVLEQILNTEKVYIKKDKESFLSLSAPQELSLRWKETKDKKQILSCTLPLKQAKIFFPGSVWYYDKKTKTIGHVTTNLPIATLKKLLSMPPVPQNKTMKVNAVIANQKDLQEIPVLPVNEKNQPVGSAVPYLYFHSLALKNTTGSIEENKTPALTLSFQYDNVLVPWHEETATVSITKEKTVSRNAPMEIDAIKLLAKSGLLPLNQTKYSKNNQEHSSVYLFGNQTPFDFWQVVVPQLTKEGWIIQIDEYYEHRLIDEPEQEWYAAVQDGKTADWFSLELGIIVQGEKINLLPIIQKILQDLDEKKQLSQIKETVIYAKLPNGYHLPIQGERMYHIMHTLLELFDKKSLDLDNTLTLSKSEAARLIEIEKALGAAQMRWLSTHKMQSLAKKIADFKSIKKLAPPKGLNAELRPYQQEGLEWMQFLREYDLAGILADDMGLGKTIQALSHILIEKESGRMTKPALIIAPTTLMFNWEQESQRFAPDLKVLVLHGTNRKENFNSLEEYDVILTTYPLILRDKEQLLQYTFHLLILDEAQYIKNSKSLSAQVLIQIHANHRLCLTGTPIENHLGELWSLFHFLMPGLLSDSKSFTRRYSTPIEQGDHERKKTLSRRVAPFILRRTKSEVAKELPPKIETISYVELEPDQRDLYETIRIAMAEKVRNEVAKLGLARSHIVILDALLKLRQVCCDPELLSISQKKKGPVSSAKMQYLQETLPELVEEGRRILIFSSFTKMLDRIEGMLSEQQIGYVRLTGETKDRKTPIQKFQNLEVPVFLISLKAGGTGLNLTAADTVIHVDPWWNPAAENQATDRAYRIGQDKTVFVYKIVTKGTIEEKILEMQAKKKALAESIFSEQTTEKSKLTENDLQSLFAAF